MSLLDVLPVWVVSIEQVVGRAGGSVVFSRSSADRLNESAHVVVKRGRKEAELILWDSGEAEFARVDGDEIGQQHFDHVDDHELGAVLAALLEVLDG